MINIPLDGLTSRSWSYFHSVKTERYYFLWMVKAAVTKMSTALSRSHLPNPSGDWREPMCDLQFLTPGLRGFILETSVLDCVVQIAKWTFKDVCRYFGLLSLGWVMWDATGHSTLYPSSPHQPRTTGPQISTLPRLRNPAPDKGCSSLERILREMKPVNQMTSFKQRVSFLTVSRDLIGANLSIKDQVIKTNADVKASWDLLWPPVYHPQRTLWSAGPIPRICSQVCGRHSAWLTCTTFEKVMRVM